MAEKRYPMDEAEPWHDYYVIRKCAGGWRYVYYWGKDVPETHRSNPFPTKAEALHAAADDARKWKDYGGGPVSKRLREAARAADGGTTT